METSLGDAISAPRRRPHVATKCRFGSPSSGQNTVLHDKFEFDEEDLQRCGLLGALSEVEARPTKTPAREHACACVRACEYVCECVYVRACMCVRVRVCVAIPSFTWSVEMTRLVSQLGTLFSHEEPGGHAAVPQARAGR